MVVAAHIKPALAGCRTEAKRMYVEEDFLKEIYFQLDFILPAAFLLSQGESGESENLVLS